MFLLYILLNYSILIGYLYLYHSPDIGINIIVQTINVFTYPRFNRPMRLMSRRGCATKIILLLVLISTNVEKHLTEVLLLGHILKQSGSHCRVGVSLISIVSDGVTIHRRFYCHDTPNTFIII